MDWGTDGWTDRQLEGQTDEQHFSLKHGKNAEYGWTIFLTAAWQDFTPPISKSTRR